MMPKGGVLKNQIQTKWMCYNCFVAGADLGGQEEALDSPFRKFLV